MTLRRILLSLALLASHMLQGEIIETPHFSDILKHIDSETFVLLDIDDTLLLPIQTLGTDVWFLYRFKQLQESFPKDQALDKALAEWEAVRHLTKVKLVEEGTDAVVDKVQKQAQYVMGLTTQGLALTTRTINQLNGLNIDLAKYAPSKEDHYFINGHGVLYRDGILFTSGTAKGPALLTLLDIMKVAPKKIVFINDKKTHLADVEASVEAKGIKFIGLRYSIGDERVKNFDPKLAEMEWNRSTLGNLLSDQDASRILSEK